MTVRTVAVGVTTAVLGIVLLTIGITLNALVNPSNILNPFGLF